MVSRVFPGGCMMVDATCSHPFSLPCAVVLIGWDCNMMRSSNCILPRRANGPIFKVDKDKKETAS